MKTLLSLSFQEKSAIESHVKWYFKELERHGMQPGESELKAFDAFKKADDLLEAPLEVHFDLFKTRFEDMLDFDYNLDSRELLSRARHFLMAIGA
jgi:hypothetical protein